MGQHTIAEAQDSLPALIDRALAGELVVIARQGEPVVELKPCGKPPASPGRGLTQEALKQLDRIGLKLPPDAEDAGIFVSRMRDEEWR